MPFVYLATLILLLVALVSRRKPSTSRDWQDDVARQAYGEIGGDTLTVHGVRDTRYGPPGEPYDIVWETRTYDLGALKRLWFAVESFSKLSVVAHTFVSFEFDDGQFLAVSVEARPEKHESYSIVGGLLRHFELCYLFGDERDFIGRRTLYQEHEVYLYSLITPKDEVRRVLEHMIRTANTLRTRPRFYNSITDNCTSVLRQHANEVRPGSFGAFALAQVLPGISDKMLYRKGWIATDVSVEHLREEHATQQKAQNCPVDATFSKCIR